MTNRIVECVPNFSEGRDKNKIKAITDAIESVEGIGLLDVDPGAATNRTVVTFAGPPEAVLEAAFRGIKKASEVIDMRTHKGEHARQGACDVCPFIPIAGVTYDECITMANRLAESVADQLHIPVYMYAMAAKRPERERLPDIREGEYEALEEKLQKPEYKPDYGAAVFNAHSGATVIGVRKFLIAYNVSLNTKNVKIAKEIGKKIREKGFKGIPGLLKHVQATGWYISEYQRAQVTINILDHKETPLHVVFEAVKDEAERLGARITGSELVGLIPKDAMLEAGRYFLKKQGSTTGVPERELIRIAVLSMGMAELSPFDIDKKIIEYNVAGRGGLIYMNINDFIDELSSDSPAPGGGSVSALAGSLSAALSAMVAGLTFSKKGYEDKKETMENIGNAAQKLKAELLSAVDEDTEAFNKVMAAMKMPKKTDDEKARRAEAIEDASKGATIVPLSVLEKSIECLKLAAATAEFGNQNSLSDAGVAGLMGRSQAFGAYYNVLINLSGINDTAWKEDIKKKADKFVVEAESISKDIERSLLEKLNTK